VPELSRRHAVAENTIYRWKSKSGGITVFKAKRLRELEQENARLTRLLPERYPRYGYPTLALHDIEHRTTKVRSPRTNGFVERMNRTLLDEHFRIKGREKWYESVEDIQADLDVFIEFYNLKRSHQGYRLKGRTPAQALRDALGKRSCHRSSRRRMKTPSPRRHNRSCRRP